MLHGADAERDGRHELARGAHGPDAPQSAAERRNPGGVHRYGHGHPAGRPPQDFRTVFHHQAAGAGHGSRPVGRIRHRRRASRPHRGRIADGRRNQLQGVPSGRMKILVVEDDKTVGDYVRRGLDEAGYNVELVGDGDEGLRRASGRGANYDIMVLDLRLPKVSGIEVLRTLRDRGVGLPVLVLTAQDSVDFKVQALRMGADDYVTKPFAFEELLARVEALGRRPKAIAPPTLKVNGLVLDTGSREVTRDGKRIELTPKEYAVLEYLMRHQGRVMSRTLITEYAWDYHFDPGKEPKLIHTVRGVGYVVRA